MCIAIEKMKGNCAAIDSAIRYCGAHITDRHWDCLQNIKGNKTFYHHRRTQLAKPRRQRKQRYSYTTIRTGKQIKIIRTKHENPHSYTATRTGKAMTIRGKKHESPHSYSATRTGKGMTIQGTKHERPHSYTATRIGKEMTIRGTKHEQPLFYTAIRTGKGMAIHGTKQENPHSYAVKRIGKAKRRLSREHGGRDVCKEILYAGWQDRLIYVLNKAFLPCKRRPSTPKNTPFLTLERHLLLSYSLTV